MAFVCRLMSKEEMLPYKNNFRFQNNGGNPLISERIAIDNERNIFLLSPGAVIGGPEGDPSKYVLKMEGIYIEFYGDYYRDKAIDSSVFKIGDLYIPMNLISRTNEIMDIMEEALRSFLGRLDGQLDKSPYIFDEPIFVAPNWCIDEAEDIILSEMGYKDDFSTYEAEYLVMYAFSQGERLHDHLYRFRLFCKDMPVDFLAWYLNGADGPVWKVAEAAVPVALMQHSYALVSQIPMALKRFSDMVDAAPTASIDVADILISEGPEEETRSIIDKAKIYPSKFWGVIPGAKPFMNRQLFLPNVGPFARDIYFELI